MTATPLGGRLLSASQLVWFLLLPPRGFGVLTTVGRRTGKRRRKCVRAVRHGNRIYRVSLRGLRADWMHNVRVEPRVDIRIREGTFHGLARLIETEELHDEARSAYCGTVNPFDRLEYLMHRSGRPTPDRIRELHEHWFSAGTPLTIELADEQGAGTVRPRRP